MEMSLPRDSLVVILRENSERASQSTNLKK